MHLALLEHDVHSYSTHFHLDIQAVFLQNMSKVSAPPSGPCLHYARGYDRHLWRYLISRGRVLTACRPPCVVGRLAQYARRHGR